MMAFNGNRLTLARQRRQLTPKLLAERSKLSAPTITRIEKNEVLPKGEVVERLASILNYPIEFFFLDDFDSVDHRAVSFRSLSKMKASERDAAIAACALGVQLTDWLAKKFSLPEPDLLDLRNETDLETPARALRHHWRLGIKPIGSLVRLLESKGVRILSLSERTKNIDAFSCWRSEHPYIFLNNYKTAERSRFDAAHELGHLVLHRHGTTSRDKSLEREADQFASCFLMPAEDVTSKMPRVITTDVIFQAKEHWRVSAMAMARRVHALKLISDWQYKDLCINLGRLGYRTDEPRGIEREMSAVWPLALSKLWKERITKSEIAAKLHIPLDELEALIFGISVPVRVPPGDRPPLRSLTADS